MRPLTAQGVVEAWGRGERAPAPQRSLALLSVAYPEASAESLANMSLGERDAELLRLRSKTFGQLLKAYANCTECNAMLRFELDAEEILEEVGTSRNPGGELTLDVYQVRFRSPSSQDLARAAAAASSDEGRAVLLDSCVVEATAEGRRIPAADLPDAVVQAIGEGIEELDPLVEIPLDLQCGVCGEHCRVQFDITSFLWAEVAAAAQRLMYDVYRLARASGWSEREILEMGEARRRHYLELAFG